MRVLSLFWPSMSGDSAGRPANGDWRLSSVRPVFASVLAVPAVQACHQMLMIKRGFTPFLLIGLPRSGRRRDQALVSDDALRQNTNNGSLFPRNRSSLGCVFSKCLPAGLHCRSFLADWHGYTLKRCRAASKHNLRVGYLQFAQYKENRPIFRKVWARFSTPQNNLIFQSRHLLSNR